jgi:hypothetical protein
VSTINHSHRPRVLHMARGASDAINMHADSPTTPGHFVAAAGKEHGDFLVRSRLSAIFW